jgi:very-short-patch-repair endonuclease
VQRHSKLTRRQGFKSGLARRPYAPPDAAERKLWSVLRDAPVAGLKFSRRLPLGPFVVAFCCPAAKLVVEIGKDGPDEAAKNEWLRDHGYRVLNFSPDDVRRDPGMVPQAIARLFEIRVVPRP